MVSMVSMRFPWFLDGVSGFYGFYRFYAVSMVAIIFLRFPWVPWFLWFPVALCGLPGFFGFYAVSAVSIMHRRCRCFSWDEHSSVPPRFSSSVPLVPMYFSLGTHCGGRRCTFIFYSLMGFPCYLHTFLFS